MQKLKKWSLRIAVSILVLVCLFFLVVVPLFITHFMTHSNSRPWEADQKATPAHFNLEYTEVAFPSADPNYDFMLSGWYIPNQQEKGLIILGHGLFRSRHETFARAIRLTKAGYSTLVYDFRRHGESGEAKTSMGYLERYDVMGAYQFARDSLSKSGKVYGYGVSMGAVATLLAAKEKTPFDALIIESSFLSFDHTLSHHLKLWLGLPRFPIGSVIATVAKWRIGFSGEDFDLEQAVAHIQVPVLFIAGAEDRRMPPQIAERLFNNCASDEKKLLVFPRAGHGKAYDSDPKRFVSEINQFLQSLTKPNMTAHEK